MDWRTVTFDWNRARAFLVTADEGSFSAAAAALGVAQPTIGRQVAALEEELGVVLLERVGRGVALTEAGLELAEHVREMGEAASKLGLAASGHSTSLEGVVCVTASEVVGARLLPPVVARVRDQYPGIEVELVATNEVRDLRRREADIAIRHTRPDDPDLIVQKVRDSAIRLYASPGYVEKLGRPTQPRDLDRAEFFGFDRSERMIQGFRAIGLQLTARNFPIVTANHLVQWELTRQGLGICAMMEEVGDADPSVVRVLDTLTTLPLPVWMVAHRGLRTSRRMKVVWELLGEALRGGGR